MMITGERKEKDIKIIDDDTTALLNETGISGRTQQMQTERVIYVFNSTGTQTVTEDFILTGAFLNVTVAGSNVIHFNTVATLDTQIIGLSGVGILNLTFPNWFVPAGTVLASNEGGTMLGEVFGYKA